MISGRNLLIIIICILISISIIAAFKFRNVITYHHNRLNSIPSQVYNSKYGEIEYLLQGEGPTILVSHGITGGVDQGLGLSEDYLGSKYRFLCVSRFGYLKSSIPHSASPGLQADIYNELIEYLGIDKIFIFGNSAGSTSAIHFAIKYHEKCSGLILVSPNAPMNVPPGQPPLFVFQSNFVYWSVMKLAGRSMMGMFVPKELLNDLPKQEKNQLIQDIFFSALPVTRRSKGIEFDLLVSNPSINGNIQFDRITSPTLILNAVDDPATLIEGARNLETVIHGSQLLTFDTGGHVLLGHGEEIKSQISDFIQVHQ